MILPQILRNVANFKLNYRKKCVLTVLCLSTHLKGFPHFKRSEGLSQIDLYLRIGTFLRTLCFSVAGCHRLQNTFSLIRLLHFNGSSFYVNLNCY